ncbi:hypothetical protein Taro_030399 [Colocasia esculenta]|uniref:Uncharacterized protein n=1 Tax=Colocasia esculenta TaxID=4460 RepID=A0A843W034_COLES|nr:hypothetical protein [Colocasia esculenta]
MLAPRARPGSTSAPAAWRILSEGHYRLIGPLSSLELMPSAK